jgi:Holliday junction resolvase
MELLEGIVSKTERNKGARGEGEVARIFQAAGFDAERVPNSGGLRIKGDLYGDLPAHVEVKRQETARPWLWWAQAAAEAPDGVLPLVAFRRNGSKWLAIVELEPLVALLASAGVDRSPVGGAS